MGTTASTKAMQAALDLHTADLEALRVEALLHTADLEVIKDVLSFVRRVTVAVDLSVDAGVTIAGPLVLLGVYCTTALSAHTVAINDAASLRMTLPASTAINTSFDPRGMKFTTSLVVVPNAASTGTIILTYEPAELS